MDDDGWWWKMMDDDGVARQMDSGGRCEKMMRTVEENADA